MRQKDWIRFVFGDLVTGEIEDPSFECLEDDTIHVVSMIFAPLRAMDDYFRRCRESCSNIVLYHAGDEWFSGGCEPYRHFDNVVRELPSFFTRSVGIACIPLGCPVSGSLQRDWPPSSERPLVWSFAGEIRNTRIEMVRDFDKISPREIIDTSTNRTLSVDRYHDLLSASKFVPCGMGNVITETWRVYEAIESGAIPIVERRMTLDYYRELLGEHPIPTFNSWRRAADFVTDMMQRPAEMNALQGEIAAWWKDYKDRMVRQIGVMLGESHSTSLVAFSNSLVNKNMVIHEGLRVVELVRHQSLENLRRRAANPLAPVRRIWRGLRKSDER